MLLTCACWVLLRVHLDLFLRPPQVGPNLSGWLRSMGDVPLRLPLGRLTKALARVLWWLLPADRAAQK